MSNFPKEVVIEILMLLEVKPLLRFRCLSEELCNQINSSNFIKSHLKESMESRTHRKLILSKRNKNRGGVVEFYQMDFDDEDILQEAKKLHIDLEYKIAASCNGLLLLEDLRNGGKNIVLWNPFTRRCKILPDYRFDITNTGFDDERAWIINRGFIIGYDSAIDDYKVVVTWYKQVQIFSLKSNSWSSLPDLPSKYTCGFCTGCFLNGTLHFTVSKNDESFIAVLDLPYESYSFIKLPFSEDLIDLMVLDDHLSVSHRLEDSGQIVSYLRKKDGKWSKLCTFDGKDKRAFAFKALAYSEKKDKVLIQISGGGIVWYWYDLQQNKGEAEFLGWSSKYWSDICWESLVSLGDDSESDTIICSQNHGNGKE